MPKIKQLICFDIETSSTNPNTCDALQLSAVAIDQVKLEIIPDSTFNSWIKPDTFDDPDYLKKNNDTLMWHAKNFKCDVKDFMAKIAAAPPEKVVWEQFIQYLSKYHDRAANQNMFSSPIPAGFNIIEFDMIILDRLCKKYKNTDKDGRGNIFYRRDIKDALHIASLWLSPLNELRSFSMDTLRNYFGLETEGSHEGLKDVYDEAKILIKFLKLHQTLSPRIPFKDCFKGEPNEKVAVS